MYPLVLPPELGSTEMLLHIWMVFHCPFLSSCRCCPLSWVVLQPTSLWTRPGRSCLLLRPSEEGLVYGLMRVGTV